MKSKIVTSYWMDVEGYPFQGTRASRKPRYLGSLISHCRGIKLPIVCYTHKKNEQELIRLKDQYQLDNLEIKILELTDMKLHNEISRVRDIDFEHNGLDGRGVEIMWGKFQVLEQELEGFDRVYWVDIGLQHPGIFPWRYCVPFGDKSYHTGQGPVAWANNEILQYDFTNLFNTKIFDKLNQICDDKIVTLVGGNPQTSYEFKQHGIINYDIIKYFPIGGLIGGDTKQLKKYIDSYWDISGKVLNNNFLCTEESIMKVVYDKFDENHIIPFSFDVHQTNEHDEFHFEMWEKNWNKPKPLYMVWHEILNS
jgi:hypothetical protein